MAIQKTLLSTLSEQRKKNKRKTRPQVPLYPIVSEREYRRELRELVRYTRMLIQTRLMPVLGETNREVNAEIRGDASIPDINAIIDGIRFSVAMRYPANRRQEMALRAAFLANASNRTQFEAKVLVPNNLPIPTAEPWLQPIMESYSYVNTRLIESIPDRYLDSVQNIVNEGVLGGVQTSEIRSQIQAEFGVSDRRAGVIARDQIGKLNGQLNRTRQEKAGFGKYRWQTSGDESVRATHARQQGKIYSWDDPPSETGHPGEDYNCRCWAEPVFDEEVDE